LNPSSWLGRGASRRQPESRLSELRFAVLDIDVTGTDVRRDRVRGIAMLPVESGSFRIADLSYCAIPEPPNAAGREAIQADYTALKVSVGEAPIVTYNPAFVRRMLEAACRANGLPVFDAQWIDIAAVAALVRDEERPLTDMEHWLERMQSGGRRPHEASYDVFVMAQLLIAVLACAEETGIDSMKSLMRNQTAHAWLRKP
jgi:DNA polymerase III alpha subunit (gram-positive type)